MFFSYSFSLKKRTIRQEAETWKIWYSFSFEGNIAQFYNVSPISVKFYLFGKDAVEVLRWRLRKRQLWGADRAQQWIFVADQRLLLVVRRFLWTQSTQREIAVRQFILHPKKQKDGVAKTLDNSNKGFRWNQVNSWQLRKTGLTKHLSNLACPEVRLKMVDKFWTTRTKDTE